MTDTLDTILAEMRERANKLPEYNAQFTSLGDALNWAAGLNAWADRLEALRGEAVAFQYRHRMYDDQPWGEWAYPRLPIEHYQSGGHETRLLFTAPPAPVVSEELREAVARCDVYEHSQSDVFRTFNLSKSDWQTIRTFLKSAGVP